MTSTIFPVHCSSTACNMFTNAGPDELYYSLKYTPLLMIIALITMTLVPPEIGIGIAVAILVFSFIAGGVLLCVSLPVLRLGVEEVFRTTVTLGPVGGPWVEV